MRAWLVFFCLLVAPAWATPPNIIVKAGYEEPTDRYGHGILGDAIEWGALRLTVDQCSGCETAMKRDFVIRLPKSRVFEDITPRLVPLADRAGPAAMVVETDLNLGARLALYDEGGLIAATPFIGRTHRWLAPIGAADLDGDGDIEYAYVDRPHLAKTVRIWRYVPGDTRLHLVAERAGYTNHRIGESEISGGLRTCDRGPEMIVADANWTTVVALSMAGGVVQARPLMPFQGAGSFRRALACQN